ncbi:MAG TPA: excinuclease ABC subunit UvrA [Phycisphaerae bacterium]|nr:excinuclease ABC subunit UvrA [Phycisphaerae bacterium]HOJ74945.1 excinuclease ABC subunit UvrA [Phycisphaerae bacterium]HOM51506.1 excinuclease ABC subunit UvrA [Phycisphaerae bacterium]HOQ87089.1 excinuclease ABC subunit UvrA [Phycisphaerae bacterium]HPP27034.1 excinuclease ABC subunit UvrA [Phycisphaerae bacterium]
MSDDNRYIRVEGARQHNLQDISVFIPRDRLVVLTGLSGSGKSSLAFDTIHAEGQRMYMETLSAYARQFLEQMAKPDIDHIEGLPPTIAIEQRSGTTSPRSTVATTTEIYDYLRLLFARVGEPHCWICGRRIDKQAPSQIVDTVLAWPAGRRIMVLAPVVRGQKGEHAEVLRHVEKEGFVRVRIDGELHDIREIPRLDKKRKHDIDVVVDRLAVKPDVAARLAESVGLALRLGNETVFIAAEKDRNQWEDVVFSTRYACPLHPQANLSELSPRLFSFNSPHGACPTCGGLGNVQEFDPDLVVPDPTLSLANGAIEAWRHGGKRLNAIYSQLLSEFSLRFNVSPDVPFQNLPEEIRNVLMFGTTPETEQKYGAKFEGVLPNLQRRWNETESESVKQRLHAYLSERPCESCGGSRLRPETLAVRIDGTNIHDLVSMTIEQAHAFLAGLKFTGERHEIAEPIVREITQRLRFMIDVGVGYLSLSRPSVTLSGGEAQRIRLATQVGSALVGICYVLDEPTIGLHQRDSEKLIRTLRRLRDAGNTVLVVEHDEDTIRAADHVIDMGPGAGSHGGRIIAQGTVEEVTNHPNSITGKYLRGELGVALPDKRRKIYPSNAIQILGAAENNLKHIDVRFPLGGLICVTGVSGSGKSTLVNEVFLKALRRRLYRSKERPGKHDRIIGASRVDKVVQIDQSPIGRSPRSNPVTYTGAFDLIRQLFAKTREAKIRGYSPSTFSFNVKGGRCEACQGQGTKRIEMHFLPDVYVECDVCKGTRYDRETLEVRYRGKSIADVLDMRVEEAIPFFSSFDNIHQILLALDNVGLGYMTLGQSSTTLSGGEAQRIKLAAELAKTPTGHTLYVLDEPTTGLHFADVDNLLRVLGRLVDKGHTVLVIEHNLEVIKMADWIIDLGPEGGDAGGRIVAEGPPEQIAANPASYTGQFLRSRLK